MRKSRSSTALALPKCRSDAPLAPISRRRLRTIDLSRITPRLGSNGLHQRGYLDRCEIGEGVGNGVGQNNLIAMPHGATGVDDVGHITFTFGGFGVEQRFARTRENLGWIVLVQEHCTD